MSSLICIASYCTEENGRLKYAKRCMYSLLDTVDFNKHRLGIYLNAPSEEAKLFYAEFQHKFESSFPAGNLVIIENYENVGTAKAVNSIMYLRKEGEKCIKMDDDVVFNKIGWVDEMEDALSRLTNIGILGLKRRDLAESTYRTDWAASKLIEVPHKAGEKWYVVEQVNHVMGTCTMYSDAMIEKCGGLYQMGGLYGFDDSTFCYRAALAGLASCFLHGIDIEHIDEGGDAYNDWKQRYSGEKMAAYNEALQKYKSGELSIYHPIEQTL